MSAVDPEFLCSAQATELVQKYTKPGPRYTSYPTAPAWHSDIGVTQLQEKLAQLKEKHNSTPMSLYVHIPFCTQICHFCGCNTFQAKNQKPAQKYVDHLLRECELYAEQLDSSRDTIQMHWGGGTPTFLEEKDISRICQHLQKLFHFSADAEIAIELDPRVTTKNQLELLKSLGFNRVSLGVQDFDHDVQVASNRVQPIELTKDFYEHCRQQEFLSINFDLIYGLPKQTEHGFAKTVKEVIAWRPDRIALFSYAHVPWLKPFQRKINASDLPAAESKFRTFVTARHMFMQAGYKQIGMDHFALPNDELAQAKEQRVLRRNFQGYTTKPQSHVYAFGTSGISDLHDLYVQNEKKFNRYYDLIDNNLLAANRGMVLNADDVLRRHVISAIMCNGYVNFSEVEQDFSIDFHEYFKEELRNLETLQADDLVHVTHKELTVQPLGHIFLRNIAMPFDAYLKQQLAKEKPLFSKTV